VAQLVFDLKTERSLEQKIVRSLDPSTRRRRAKTMTATNEALIARPSSFTRIIFDLGQGLLGALLLLVGIALTLTLWLLPVGLPLALFGCALIETPRDKV
jgi:hypothetical protein